MDGVHEAQLEVLEEADELLEQAIDHLRHVVRMTDGSAAGARVRQVLAQLEMARNDDHEWLGRNSYTLERSISEFAGEDED